MLSELTRRANGEMPQVRLHRLKRYVGQRPILRFTVLLVFAVVMFALATAITFGVGATLRGLFGR